MSLRDILQKSIAKNKARANNFPGPSLGPGLEMRGQKHEDQMCGGRRLGTSMRAGCYALFLTEYKPNEKDNHGQSEEALNQQDSVSLTTNMANVGRHA